MNPAATGVRARSQQQVKEQYDSHRRAPAMSRCPSTREKGVGLTARARASPQRALL
ncbi:hypothetical protein [Paenibacillus sp. KR2-11]|uniref:hypothetical protein n=1 Tax=Paenibacillus sp. KR2-11 TaxID=3385500 RepID=UPI0038FC3853